MTKKIVRTTQRAICKICGDKMVPPVGDPKAKILVVGDYPGKDEVIQGVPFVGKVGDILKTEMQRVGLNLYACRAANMWQHAKNEANCDVEWHVDQLMQEFAGRKFILLMGSDVCKTLFHKGVLELSGLEVKHQMFPKVRIFVAPIPPYVGPVGEFRLSLERFAAAVEKAKL